MLYQPAEDSYLIQKEVQHLAKGRVLEIGIGSGILSDTAAKLKRVKSVLGVDIKKEAVEHCRAEVKSKKCKFLVSDLFDKVPKQKFDTIIFNPPYLPEQEGELWELQTDISGGKQGYEIVDRFLSSVNDYLDDDGVVLLLFSTLTGKAKVEEFIAHNMMEYDELSKLKIAWEQLFVYRIVKSRLRKMFEKKGVKGLSTFSRGHRGIIYTGKFKGKKIAIKVQRTDIDAKETVNNEVVQLKVLNKKGIGPKVLFSGKDYFAYTFVEGDFIFDYIDRKDVKKADVLGVLTDVFEQMYLLDHLKLNKEEMHHPVKHIIVGKKNKPVLLDFERCRPRPKVHNVTQFCQFVMSGRILPHLKRHNLKISMLDMMKYSKEYSKRRTRGNFEKILGLLK
ncbi:MAG: HemK2/MTQ2 family protein methyltransferase [Candidatus Woesearchaeota archaeon]